MNSRLVVPAALLLAIAAACSPPDPPPAPVQAPPAPPAAPPDPRAESTKRMAQRLADLAASAKAVDNPFRAELAVEELKGIVLRAPDPVQKMTFHAQLAETLVEAGQPREAIDEIQAIQAAPRELLDKAGPEFEHHLNGVLALAWMRVGELANCVQHHGVDSCLLPIKGGGVHSAQEGSRNAVKILESMLEKRPDDVVSRWLLNVAYMTLGEYPEKVPRKHLIPESSFASEHEMPRFMDVAQKAGVANRALSGGAIMEDFDNDGFLDIMASSWGPTDQLQLYMSRGDGTFENRTEAAGLMGLVGGLNIVQADIDNDGDADVLVPRGAWLRAGGKMPPSLLLNDGKAHFTDITEQAGILTELPTQAVAFADYDGDGVLDLFVGHESTKEVAAPCYLYHGRGDGTFDDASSSLPIAEMGMVKGAAWGDLDNDGWPDLHVSVLGKPNVLLRNLGEARVGLEWAFEDVTGRAGVGEPAKSFPTWWWDYDNDGWLDVFAAGFRQGSAGDTAEVLLGLKTAAPLPKLYRNRGAGKFEDVTHAMRLDRVTAVMGSNYGDLDNDGWLDCYLGTGTPDLRTLVPNRMFRNDRGKVFQDVTTAGGFGHVQKGHGVAFGDIDNDGDQDIYEVIGGAVTADVAQNVLFENPGNTNHWITLRLQGTRANRCAIGARVRVKVATPSGPRDIHVLAGTGGSFGASSLQQEIGLGDATEILEVEIRWPRPGETELFTGATLDAAFDAVEGKGALVAHPLAKFTLPR